MNQKVIALISILLATACNANEKEFYITGKENYKDLSSVIDLKKKDDSTFPLYVYDQVPTSIFDIYFKDIPITYGQYVFNKKTKKLCNVQYFIPKESNRELLISRINKSKEFKYIDAGDTFMWTRRMRWDGNDVSLILTSVVNSNKSMLFVEYSSPDCDY